MADKKLTGAEFNLSHEELLNVLDYDPETGEFIWKIDRPNIKKGEIAGCVDVNGYIKISINANPYYGHRLAWFYVYGAWPTFEIDHDNQDRADNRLSNLKDKTHGDNTKNQTMSSRNTSGYAGVSWSNTYNKWTAYIQIDKKRKNLGWFREIEHAISARKTAADAAGYHKNHGRKRG